MRGERTGENTPRLVTPSGGFMNSKDADEDRLIIDKDELIDSRKLDDLKRGSRKWIQTLLTFPVMHERDEDELLIEKTKTDY